MDYFDLDRFVAAVAAELNVQPQQARAAVELLDGGNTLPFIARYRKEATRSLDEIALRAIEDALGKARELASRKATILNTIEEQGNLTAELKQQVIDCQDKQTLEDLYLPYKPKRRTRATMARERGLQPLAELLLAQQPFNGSRSELLSSFVDAAKDVPDAEAALQGACDIVAEQWSEQADTRAWLSAQCRDYGKVHSTVKRGKKEAGEKFEAYFDRQESLKRIPSHRFLAMKRGETEGMLNIRIDLNDEIVLRKLTSQLATNRQFPFYRELTATVEDCYRRLLLPSVESGIFQEMKDRADEEAIAVFAKNLRELLLAAPAGPMTTIGLDPGFRTGCKVAVVDSTGKFLESATIYPTPAQE